MAKNAGSGSSTNITPGVGTSAGQGGGSFSGGGGQGSSGHIGGGSQTGSSSQGSNQSYSGGQSYQGNQVQQQESYNEPQQESVQERHKVAQTEAVKPRERSETQEKDQQQQVAIAPKDIDISSVQQTRQGQELISRQSSDLSAVSVPQESGYENQEQVQNGLNELDVSMLSIPNAVPARQARQEQRGKKPTRGTVQAETTLASLFDGLEDRATENTTNIQNVTPHTRQAPQPETSELPSRQVKASQDAIQDKAKSNVQKKNYRGNAITDIMLADDRVKPEDVSIGDDVIAYVLEQPRNSLLPFLIEQSNGALNESSTIAEVRAFVNSQNFDVVASKSPINRGSSTQARRLRIHNGRGIRIHPTQAKSFNADFDSDQMSVAFDFANEANVLNAMAYLVDIDGNVTIDPDFFPMPMLTGTEEELRYLSENVLAAYPGSTEIRKALVELSQDVGSNEKWLNLINAMNRTAVAMTSEERAQYHIMSEMLDSIYSGMRRLKLLQVQQEASRPINQSDYQIPVNNAADMGIMEILDTALGTGTLPLNFQDFRRIMAKYNGEIEGKNVSFRLGASVAKLINWDRRIQIGRSNMHDLYEHTMEAALTRAMSNRIKLGDRNQAVGEILRNEIISRVGLPGANMSEWLGRFIVEYRLMQNLMNAAGVEFLTDFRTARRDKQPVRQIIPENPSMKDIVGPLINIYGDYTIGKFFRDAGAKFGHHNYKRRHELSRALFIDVKYELRTIRSVSQSNIIPISNDEAREIGENLLSSYNDNTLLAHDLLYLIADKQSAKASRFNRTMTEPGGVHGQLYNVVKKIRKLGQSHRSDYQQWREELFNLLYAVNPNLFAYYNMTSPDNFIQGRYGKAIRRSRSADQVGGIRLAMLVEYRLAQTEVARKRLSSERVSGFDVQNLVKRIEEYSMELDTLAESSDAWATIVSELRSTKSESRFQELKTGNYKIDLKKSNLYYQGWQSIQENSLLDVLLSTNIGYEDKINILGDVSRLVHSDVYQVSWAMAYQLEIDPGATFASGDYGGDGGIFDTLESFNSAMNKYDRNSYEKAAEAIDNAAKKYEDKPETLNRALLRLADNPNIHINVSSEMFADAVLGSLDKTYSDSEKSRQAAAAHAYYQALMLQRVGGFFSDVFVTDNNVLGVILKRQANEKHLIQILAHPEKTIWIVDEYGRVCPVSRSSLCGSNSEKDLWAWLKEHPRLALALRPHIANVIADRDAQVFLSAARSLEDFLGDQELKPNQRLAQQMKVFLRDQPKFGALAGFFLPVSNNPSRNLRSDVIANEQALIRVLTNYAKLSTSGNVSAKDFTIDQLGITPEKLMALGCDRQIAQDFFSEVVQWVGETGTAVAQMAEECDYSFTGQLLPVSLPSYDLDSLANYYDVKQQLNGAKTQLSTGIEGQETFNLAIWAAILAPRDTYANLGCFSREEVLAQLQEATTLTGEPITEENVDELLSRSDDESSMTIRVPETFIVPDKTLDDYGQQISSVATYLVIKRDEGAEKFNLKAKKLGDDGTNSITKLSSRVLYDSGEQYYKTQDRVIRAYEQGGIEDAKLELAGILKEANESLGYKDMDLANYMNLADLMVAENTETHEVKIRSLEQIIYAVKNRLSYDLIENGSLEEIRTAARQIAATVGFESYNGDPSRLFDNVAIHGFNSFAPVIRERSSSWHRNFNLLSSIAKKNAGRGITILDGERLEEAKSNARKRSATVDRLANMFSKGRGLIQYDLLGQVGVYEEQSLGPSAAYVVDGEIGSLAEYYRRGNTVFIRHPETNLQGNAAKLLDDCIPVSWINEDGWYMLPFFDMQLNGSKVMSTSFGKVGSWSASDDSVVWLFEDTTGEYAVGDAKVQLFNSLVDRISINWSDQLKISMADLFPDTFAVGNADESYSFSLASDLEIQRFVLQDREEFAIDYGVAMSDRSFAEQKERIDRLIQEYRDNAGKRNSNGMLTENCHPNQIVGWMRCDITNTNSSETRHVFAPIIPWRLGGTSAVPTDFSIDGGSYSKATNSITLNWTYTGDPRQAYYKMFDGSAASNKMMGSARDAVDGGQLRSGVSLDAAVSDKSTASRRLGTDKRLSTMVTMFFAARRAPYGYNFAEQFDSFPNDPEWKQRLINERIPIEAWDAKVSQEDIVYSSEPRRNAFIRHEVSLCLERGINPSDFLASYFGGQRSCVHFEYQALMETNHEYQNNLLDFFHNMMPTLCPDSIEGNWSECLFRPCQSEGFDNGCMQMQVPHHNPDTGETFYVWENVYASWSFFGQEYSGFHQPNINGSSKMMDQLNTLALSGRVPNGLNFRSMLKWATSDLVYPTDTKNAFMVDINKTMTSQREDIDA